MVSSDSSFKALVAQPKPFSLAFVRQQSLTGSLPSHLRPMVIQARTSSALSYTDDLITPEPSVPKHYLDKTGCFSAHFMTKCASTSSVQDQVPNCTASLQANALLSADFLDRLAPTGRDPLALLDLKLPADLDFDGPNQWPTKVEERACNLSLSSSPSPAAVAAPSSVPTRFKAIRGAWHVVLVVLSMMWALAARTHDIQQFIRSVQAFDYHAVCSHPLSSYDTLHVVCPAPLIDNYASLLLGAQYLEGLSSPPADLALVNGLRTVLGLSEVAPHEPSVPLENRLHNLTAKRCWPLNGSHARYGVSLPHPIYVTNITMGHLLDSVELAASAPRDVTVWALVDLSRISTIAQKFLGSAWLPSHSGLRDDLASKLKPGQDLIPLARMRYDIHSKAVTQAAVPQPAYIWKRLKVSGVVFEIHDNWGDAGQTCLYGVEVYGYTF